MVIVLRLAKAQQERGKVQGLLRDESSQLASGQGGLFVTEEEVDEDLIYVTQDALSTIDVASLTDEQVGEIMDDNQGDKVCVTEDLSHGLITEDVSVRIFVSYGAVRKALHDRGLRRGFHQDKKGKEKGSKGRFGIIKHNGRRGG